MEKWKTKSAERRVKSNEEKNDNAPTCLYLPISFVKKSHYLALTLLILPSRPSKAVDTTAKYLMHAAIRCLGKPFIGGIGPRRKHAEMSTMTGLEPRVPDPRFYGTEVV